MQLTLTAQLNAIAELARLSHLDALSGDVKSAVHLLNKARGLMGEVLRNVGSGTNQSHRTQEVLVTPAHESSSDDSKLLDEISQAQLGKSYGKANETQQQVIRQLATRVLGREVNEDNEGIDRQANKSVRGAANIAQSHGRTYTGSADRIQNKTGAITETLTPVGEATRRTQKEVKQPNQISYKQWLRENRR